MTGRSDWFSSAGVVSEPAAEHPHDAEHAHYTEHPHDTEDLIRLVLVIRQDKGWTQAALAEAAGVPESDVARFEAGEVVPAKPSAIRYLEALGVVEPGLF
jgi:ribosome-binding protein aMBF1 (putative translation factor)